MFVLPDGIFSFFLKKGCSKKECLEFKLRMTLLLEQKGSPQNNNEPEKKIIHFLSLCEGLSLAKWRDFIADVVNSINNFKKKPLPKSRLKLLADFFTRKTVHLPSITHFFKFELGEKVVVDLTTRERRDLSYKWSLHPGLCCKIKRKNVESMVTFSLHCPFKRHTRKFH
jgi:hypothetical protein